jgi:hypothetical protein
MIGSQFSEPCRDEHDRPEPRIGEGGSSRPMVEGQGDASKANPEARKPAARTALPQPPKTSQNVPINSAPNFRPSDMFNLTRLRVPSVRWRSTVIKRHADNMPIKRQERFT